MHFTTYLRQRLAPYPSAKQFIKFSLIGSTSAVVHFSILLVLTEGFVVWYLVSNGIGFMVSAMYNFTANKLWTFRNREGGAAILRQALKYLTVLLTGLTINTAIIFGITEWFGLDYRISWVFAALLVAGWNFCLNRFWTFRAKLPAAGPALPN